MASGALSENGKKYTFVELLGKGGYSSVSKVKDDTGQVYARKTIDTHETPAAIKNEIAIMKRLHHEHIICVVDQMIANDSVSLIMSPVADCDLAHYLAIVDETEAGESRDILLSRMQCWPDCLLATLDFLHDLKIKHRDLKPRNILVKGDSVLIADFGIAHNLVDETTTGSRGMPDRFSTVYCAPETFDGRRGRASDVFSLGCIFLEMEAVMTGPTHNLRRLSNIIARADSSRSYYKAERSILNWLSEPRQGYRRFFPSTLVERCFLMLDPDPKQRITARQSLAHSSKLELVETHRRLSSVDCALSDGIAGHLSSFAIFCYNYVGSEKSINIAFGSDQRQSVPATWEEAKKLWLSNYIWWPTSVATPRGHQ